MRTLGFNRTIPQHWNKWWLAMWAVTSPILIVSAFHLRFWMWVVAAIVGFLVPEMISEISKDQGAPVAQQVRAERLDIVVAWTRPDR